jgi:hypothetical protein
MAMRRSIRNNQPARWGGLYLKEGERDVRNWEKKPLGFKKNNERLYSRKRNKRIRK